MKLVALALSVSLLACSAEGGSAAVPPPGTSPTVDLLRYRGSDGSSSLGVSFAQPDQPDCDATDFLLPGEHRVEDDVIHYCPTTTCVSEVRLLRDQVILGAHPVTSAEPWATFTLPPGPGLALELRGCGAPRRLPVWESTLPQGARASLVTGEPGAAIRIATDMPAADVSLSSIGAGGLGDERDHSLAGAGSVRVGLPGYHNEVGIDAIQAHGTVDLDGLEVRRWSGQSLYTGTLCLPVQTGDRWDIGCASRNGATTVTLGAAGDTSVVDLRPSRASLDRPEVGGRLTWEGEALEPSSSVITALELTQGASTDTLGLRRRTASPLRGPLYQATTAHVEPDAPLAFGIDGDDLSFAITYGALHFVNTEDASDSFDVDGLAFRWAVVPIVPRP